MTECNSNGNFGSPNKFLFSKKMYLELAWPLFYRTFNSLQLGKKLMLSSYFVHGHYPFREPTVFWEWSLHLRKTVTFKEQILFKDKYWCIFFLRKLEVNVFITLQINLIHNICNLLTRIFPIWSVAYSVTWCISTNINFDKLSVMLFLLFCHFLCRCLSSFSSH